MEHVEKLMRSLQKGEAGLVVSPENRFYVTGQHTTAGTVLVTPEQAYLIIDFRYYDKVKNGVRGLEVILQQRLYEQVDAIFTRHGVHTFYMEPSKVPYLELLHFQQKIKTARLSFADGFDRTITSARAIKQAWEIDRIRQAQQVTDETFTYILDQIKPGKTEREIALAMEFYGRKRGAQAVSFDFIVVAGEKSALPHGSPGDSVLQTGDFLTMDFGFMVDGYCSDMTRTICIGAASPLQREIYAVTLQAQMRALNEYRSGITGRQADAAARDYIESCGYGDYFGHGLGHGVGIEIHEAPTCGKSSEEILQSGMVITCEPGVYLAGKFGVRIEDMGVIRDDGFENFTKSPKSLIELK